MVQSDAILDEIAAERTRQIRVKGFDQEYDRAHEADTLATGAAFYALPPEATAWVKSHGIDHWPFGDRPKRKDRRQDLIRAAAMIVAEIELIDGESSDVVTVPDAECMIADPTCSRWLKDALRAAIMRDPIDAANDAEILYRCLDNRCATAAPGAGQSDNSGSVT